MRPLIADGGEMTILRTLAAYAFGAWSVSWPDSVPEDQRPTLGDDRDFGYVYDMPRDTGRLGRRFVRADVQITAAEHTPSGEVVDGTGSSDVEAQLDAVEKRTDGDVFFERDIDRTGLNGNTPHVDFEVGDIVPVSIWGKRVNLPVTSIEEVTAPGGVVDWRVHVGGQLIADSTARERANVELNRVIAQERRERLRQVGAVDSKASTAQATATTAQSAADTAQSTAEDAKQSAIDALAQQQADFQTFQAERDAQQDAYMEALRAVQEASIRPVQGWLFLKTASASTAENQYLRINHSSATSGTRSVEMLGSWTGKIIVTSNGEATKYVSGGDGDVDDSFTNMTEYAVPLPNGQRIITGSHDSSSSFVRVDFEVNQGVQKETKTAQGAQVPPPSTWVQRTSHTFTAGTAITDAMGLFRVTWAKATYWGTFGVRILVNGQVLAQRIQENLGPLFGAGERTQQVSFTGVNLRKGDGVTFEVYTNQEVSDISGSIASISWIE